MNTIDSADLIQLAHDKSAQGRKVLAETVSDLFLGGTTVLSSRERDLMFDILHQIVRDAEMEVRRIIAKNLASQADTPRELAAFLSNDQIEVAYPILTQCEVLEDRDLIEVIRQRTLEHQMAIAIRESISADVSDALVKGGDEAVIRTLLENSGASISDGNLERLVGDSESVQAYREPIIHRDDLNPDLAKRMFMWVSAALRKHILSNFEFKKEVIDDMLEGAALEGSGFKPAQGDVEDSNSADVREVTPDLLVAALGSSRVHNFVSLFGRLTGLRRTLVTRLLLEPGGEGMTVACRAVGFSRDEFDALFRLSRKVGPTGGGSVKREIQDALKFFDSISEEAAVEVLQYWRRDVDYLSAIRRLDLKADNPSIAAVPMTEVRRRMARLTPQERKVLDRVVAGDTNKKIAEQLSRSVKTVEFHRAKLMKKMKADNFAELVRMAMSVEGGSSVH